MNQTLTGPGNRLALAIVVYLSPAGSQLSVAAFAGLLSCLSRARSLLGVAVMLWITGTSLNVQSFMGANPWGRSFSRKRNSAGHVLRSTAERKDSPSKRQPV